jgi:predicted aspartyl protease
MAERSCTSCGGHGGAEGRLTLAAHVNGKGPFELFVDTGAGRTVVSPRVAEEAGLPMVRHEMRKGVGGETRVDLTGAASIVVDGQLVELESLGISDVPERLCGEVAGVVGFDVLRHFCLSVDYATGRAALHTDSLGGGGTQFRVASGRKPLILVDVSIDGTGSLPFALDTGAGGTCISPDLAARLELGRGEDVMCLGVGGPSEAYVAASPMRCTIGSTTMSVTPIVLDVFSMLSHETSTAIHGLIGHDILSRQSLFVDYPREVLRLGGPI